MAGLLMMPELLSFVLINSLRRNQVWRFCGLWQKTHNLGSASYMQLGAAPLANGTCLYDEGRYSYLPCTVLLCFVVFI
jgi:hypothetical protein